MVSCAAGLSLSDSGEKGSRGSHLCCGGHFLTASLFSLGTAHMQNSRAKKNGYGLSLQVVWTVWFFRRGGRPAHQHTPVDPWDSKKSLVVAKRGHNFRRRPAFFWRARRRATRLLSLSELLWPVT